MSPRTIRMVVSSASSPRFSLFPIYLAFSHLHLSCLSISPPVVLPLSSVLTREFSHLPLYVFCSTTKYFWDLTNPLKPITRETVPCGNWRLSPCFNTPCYDSAAVHSTAICRPVPPFDILGVCMD